VNVRPGAVAAVLATLAAALPACGRAGAEQREHEVTLVMHWSRFDRANVEVPRGVPVRFVYVNDDPIAHEVLVGDEAFQERHEKGTEAAHGHRPDETEVPANTTRTTTLTFDRAGTLHFACHLPGHYAYGMKGTVTVR
jgi:uncharacterized cupredoxin-like copper-binding protein